MATILTVSSLFISFFVTLIIMPSWIKRALDQDLVGKDVHKNHKKIAEAGGIIVVLGAIIGVLFYVALLVFYFKNTDNLVFILATLCTILIALMIGFVDDILGWRIGIRQRDKILISLLIPIPLMVVNSGHNIMNIPFLGSVNLGLFYPLLVIPIAIFGSSNGFNMLAGYNGLEAGMGFIILSTLGIISWISGSGWVALIAFSMSVALFAFLLYNWYPSKVFPGDTMTYPVGATIAIVAILANLEKFALILFSLYFVEFILKARGKFVPDWKSTLSKDNTLSHKGKWYTMSHIAISFLKVIGIKTYENRVVITVLCAQLVVASLTLGYYMCC